MEEGDSFPKQKRPWEDLGFCSLWDQNESPISPSHTGQSQTFPGRASTSIDESGEAPSMDRSQGQKPELLLTRPAVWYVEEARLVLVLLGAKWRLEPEKEVEAQGL